MTISTFVLQAGAAAAQAQPQGSTAGFWIMILLVFLVMWLFMIRPQNKQRKEIEKFRSELKKGDKVITAGGIYGSIADIDETTVLLKIDGEVKIRVDKTSIQRDPSAPKPAEEKK